VEKREAEEKQEKKEIQNLGKESLVHELDFG
jgi:hypothetical protein